MKRSLSLFLILFAQFCFSQQDIQSLDSIIPNANKYYVSNPDKARDYLLRGVELAEAQHDDYRKALFLTKMITQKNRARDFDSAQVYFEIAKDFILENKAANILLPDVHSEIAETYFYKEELDKALRYFGIADSLYNKLGDSIGVLISKNNIANVYQLKGNYKLAISNLLEAAKNVDTTKYKYIKTDIYGNVSELYNSIDALDKSIEYAEKSLAVALTDKKFPSKLAYAYNNVASKYRKKGEYQKAQKLLNHSFAIIDSLDFKSMKPMVLTTQSAIYLSQDQFRKAKTVIEAALQMSKEFKRNKNETFPLKVNLAICYKQLGNAQAAITILNEALQEAEGGQRVNDMADAYLELSEAYAQNQNYKNAYQNHKLYTVFNDSILGIEKQKAIQDSEVKYQTVKKEKQILTQRADIAERDLLLQKRNFQVYGLIGLVVVIALLGYLFYNQQKLKHTQLKKENELKIALAKIETQNRLQEQRLRISRDLHDNIGAQLTFIISSLDNLKYGFEFPEALEGKLSTISQFTSATIYELRDTIWAMNKDAISFEDLQSRISNFIEKANLAAQHMTYAFDVEDASLNAINFTSVQGINIYRIIQEAVNNAIKYSKGSKINVSIRSKNNTMSIEITDDGIGFDKAKVELGNGLNNMEKRAVELNATMIVNSMKDNGTAVLINMPLH